jgi:D-sedoheptulose 7-phosphate isomerase
MTRAAAGEGLAARVGELLARRVEAGESWFPAEADRLALLCHRMAERFARGGRLVAVASTPTGRSDARHVAVEFVHPVIVGKRALPAIALERAQVELLCDPHDIVMDFDHPGMAVRLVGEGGEWEFEPTTDDPFVRQELIETSYHVLWELVHVFFEHRGLLEGRAARPVHDTGASSFLYPFLNEGEHDLDAVLDDVRESVLMKSAEVAELRAQTLTESRDALFAAAGALRRVFDAGGKLLALGNGGSATDAMDAVADFRDPPPPWPPRRALDLTEDPAILTAIANDIGTDAIFQRQVIAYGREGDALLALSTSGNSRNVIEALAESRRRGLVTVAMVGYDGGRVADEALADHVVVTRSEHIPRIQEAQASAYHALRELVELPR